MNSLRETVLSLSEVRAKRQAELAELAGKITLLWDRLSVEASVREAWVAGNNQQITDAVIEACSTCAFYRAFAFSWTY